MPTRAVIVSAIGGLLLGHILWLVAISLAINTSDVPFWVLVVSGVITVLAGVIAALGWRAHQRKDRVATAFLWSVPVAPMLLTLTVLAVTYL